MKTRRFVLDRNAAGQEQAVTIHYDSDLSGSVVIVTQNKQGEGKTLHVPGWVLVDFVAERVAAERIAQLEQAPVEALGVPADWPGGRWGNGRT